MVEGGLLEEHANSKLREAGHSLLILEEVLSGRLYTGPLYMKVSWTALKPCALYPVPRCV